MCVLHVVAVAQNVANPLNICQVLRGTGGTWLVIESCVILRGHEDLAVFADPLVLVRIGRI